MHAGVFADRMVTTGDGYELTWQVNVLAPYVLGALLVNAVKERIINVSSISAGSRINFDNLNQVGPISLQKYIFKVTIKDFPLVLIAPLTEASEDIELLAVPSEPPLL